MAGQRFRTSVIPAAMLAALFSGCAGNARVELAAADSVEMLGASMRETLAEYHADIVRFDAERRRAAVQAFIGRVRTDVADDAAIEVHAAAFQEALRRLDADQHATWERYTASLENVAALHEIARGLRRLALDSMSPNDDLRRYFGEAVERHREAREKGRRESNDEGQ